MKIPLPFRLSLLLLALLTPETRAATPSTPAAVPNPYITPEMERVVEETLSQMTLEEKVELCNGDIEKKTPNFRGAAAVDRLGIGPAIFYNGPRGYQAGTSSFFPAGVALGASFDPDLARREAGTIAAAARAGITDYPARRRRPPTRSAWTASTSTGKRPRPTGRSWIRGNSPAAGRVC